MKRIILGHYAPVIIGSVLFIALFSCYEVLSHALSLSVGMSVVLGAALAVVALTAWYAQRVHARNGCPRCARAMPLNPAARAEEEIFALNLFHSDPLKFWIYLAGLIGVDLLFAAVPSVGALALLAVAHVPLFYLLHVNTLHGRLQPWCLHCRQPGIHTQRPDDVLV